MSIFSKKNIGLMLCSTTLMLLIILGVLYILYTRQEGFLSSGAYPSSVITGLLAPPYGNYPMVAKSRCTPGVSEATYEDEWKRYPYTPMSCYAQITNNKQYWTLPNNGTCSPAEICGGLYQKKKVIIPSPILPPPANYPPYEVRVNYYIADS